MRFISILSGVGKPDIPTAAIVVFFVSFGVAASLLPFNNLALNLLIDDALYYPEIARNMVSGQGVTFDGSTITNGFHPLWMLVNLPIAWISPSVETNVRLLLFISGLTTGIAFYFLSGFVYEIGKSRLTVISLAFVGLWPLALWFGLIEAGLSLLMIGLLLDLSARKNLLELPTRKRAVLLGVLLALMCLARLDLVFIAIVVYSSMAIRKFASRSFNNEIIAKYGLSLAAFVCITGVYLLWNLINFGSFLPVSGTKKIELIWSLESMLTIAGISVPAIVDNPLGVVFVSIGTIAIVFAGIAAYRSKLLGLDNGVRSVLEIAIVGILLRHVVLRLIVEESPGTIWHLVPDYLLVTLIMAILISMVAKWGSTQKGIWRLSAFGVIGTIALMAVAVAFIGATEMTQRDGSTIDRYETALWAKENIDGGKWAMFDAGFIGLFSEHPTMTLNGLATDHESMELLRDNRYAEVISEHEIDYLVLYVEDVTEIWIPQSAVVYRHHSTPRTQPSLRLFVLDMNNSEVPTQRLLENAR
jgi:hypothetical protein